MKIIKILIAGCFSCVASLSMGAVDVLSFGAKGDGKTLDTAAIQKAIDKAAERGGEVRFSTGTYLTGTLVLKDNVTLYLERGAVLLASTRLEDYPPTPSRYISHINRYTHSSLIYAEGVKNISIIGEGIIDGQGTHPNFKADEKDELKSILRRPYIIRVISCDRVNINGVTLRNSPAWMQHYLDCSNLLVDGITVFNHGNYNNDGIDIDNCKNVRIVNSCFDTDDDAICFKTTNAIGKCENVVVANCVIASNCNALKWGTETNGAFLNFTVNNCSLWRSDYSTIYPRNERTLGAIALETVDGALVDGIHIDNIVSNGFMTPIFIRLADRGRNYYDGGPSQPAGILRNVSISNMTARMHGLVTSSISGLADHPVQNVSLENIHIICEGGGSEEDAFRRNIGDRNKEYPETLIFADVPAYGLFVRNVEGLRMQNMFLEVQNKDPRSALYCENVANMSLHCFTFGNPADEAPLIILNQCRNIQISGNLPIGHNDNMLQVEGTDSSHILLYNNDLSVYKKPVVFERGAGKEAVRLTGNF